MKECVERINLECVVEIIDDFILFENIFEYFNWGYDYVFDVIDSVRIKVVFIVYCKCNKIKLIIIGGVGG